MLPGEVPREARSRGEESRVPEMQLPDRWLAVLVYDAPDHVLDKAGCSFHRVRELFAPVDS